MTIFVFLPTNEFVGRLSVKNYDQIPEALTGFLKIYKGVVPPGSYLERNEDSWTIVSLDPLEIREGRHFVKRQPEMKGGGHAAKNQSSYIPKGRVDYYVLTGEERRGPYKLKQIESMWISGAIPADVNLQCGDSEPIPITSVLRRRIQPSISSAKVIFGLCVRLLGLFFLFETLISASGGLALILGGPRVEVNGLANIVSGVSPAIPFIILPVVWLLFSILLMTGASRLADRVYRSGDA